MTSPLRLIIGFSPGSASNQFARTIAPSLSCILGLPIEIDPHPGGNGVPAAALAARAAGDGNTLFVATLGTHALAPHLDPELPYSPTRDFTPVSLVSRSPLVLARGPALEVSNVRKLIDLALDDAGVLACGSSPEEFGAFIQKEIARWGPIVARFRDKTSGG